MQRLTKFARRCVHALWEPIGRAPRLLVALACLIVMLAYCTNTDMGGDPNSPRGDGKYRPVLARGDGHMMYLMARSTALDGDWIFDNDLARFGDPWGEPRTKTGRKSIVHPIGPALIWTPLILIAQGGAKIANAMGANIEEHGYTLWHQRFVFLSSVFFACGAVLLGRRLAKQLGMGPWSIGYASLAVLLGTSLTYYATFMPSYSHAMDAFGAGLFIAYWAQSIGRHDVRRFITLGALWGLAMLIRAQEIGLGLLLLIEWSLALGSLLVARFNKSATASSANQKNPWLRWILGGIATIAIAVIVFSPQLLEWSRVYGDWHALPQGAKFTRWGSPMIFEVLFSARNGWLSTTPICTAGIIGLVLLLRTSKTRVIGVGLLAAVAVQVYFGSVIFDWWGGAAFGQRRLCNVTVPIVVGVASLLSSLGDAVINSVRLRKIPRGVWHGIVVVVFGCFVAWNIARIIPLRHGRSAGAQISGCCETIPPPLHGPFQAIYNLIGDPFAFPANVWFAYKHDVPVQRWDQAVGDYALIPPLNSLVDGTMEKAHAEWNIGDGDMGRYIIAGLGAAMSPPASKPPAPANSQNWRYRWTTAPVARFLLPNLMPYGQHMTLWLAPGGSRHVRIQFDDKIVATADLADGWNAITFNVPTMTVGEHEVALQADVAIVAQDPTTPPAMPRAPTKAAVGVAVGQLKLQFMPGVDAQ